MEGPELVYPPLLPLLIAALSFPAGGFEAAARVVALIGGMALVAAIFVLTRHLYGRRVALIAAALAAAHPLFISLSTAVYSEALYLPLLLWGTYQALRAAESARPARAVLCGALLALAYLTRPDGILVGCLAVGAILVAAPFGHVPFRRALFAGTLVLGSFVILAAPYVGYLSEHAGRFLLEGKSGMNLTIGERIDAGMSHLEATDGLGRHLEEDGPWLSPNHFVAGSRPQPWSAVASDWIDNARRNKGQLFRSLMVSPAFGSFLMVALATLGLFRRPWGRWRWVREGTLLAIVFGYVAILLGQHYVPFRFLLPLLPFIVVWTAKGISEAAQWTGASLRRAVGSRATRWRLHEATVGVLLTVASLLVAVRGGTDEIQATSPQEERLDGELKSAGLWIAQFQAHSRSVMSDSNLGPYYARCLRFVFPYTDEHTALAYVRWKSPDFLVLAHDTAFPYERKWVECGIPDTSAVLVYCGGRGLDDEVAVYEWRKRGRR